MNLLLPLYKMEFDVLSMALGAKLTAREDRLATSRELARFATAASSPGIGVGVSISIAPSVTSTSCVIAR